MHTTKGIDLRCGVAVDGFTDGGVLIRAIDGACRDRRCWRPTSSWSGWASPRRWAGWRAAGLELRDGIVCDEFLRAVLPPDVGTRRWCSPPVTSRGGRTRCSATRCGSSTGRTPPSRAPTPRRTSSPSPAANRCSRMHRSRSSGAISSSTASSSSAMPCPTTRCAWWPVRSRRASSWRCTAVAAACTGRSA